ncbi:MAG: hypothetical protein AB8F95_20645 [Bacteroidia bacterium]
MVKKSVWLLIALVSGSIAQAQIPVSPSKQFWKKRVVRRIDLREKINRPLVYHESHLYNKQEYTERNGMVAALFNGMNQLGYVAYDPENWDVTYDYEALVARMQSFQDAVDNQQLDASGFFGDDTEVERLRDEFNDIMEDYEEPKNPDHWGGFSYPDSLPAGYNYEPDTSANTPLKVGTTLSQVDLSPYEESIHLVEDWIFNSQRSAMQQNIDYFEIIWTDPTGQLPEKVLARIRWEDCVSILEKTQWKNRFNDAEVRSIREVLELRIFHSYAINISGESVTSLPEAAKRQQEMVDFEHYLWSY